MTFASRALGAFLAAVLVTGMVAAPATAAQPATAQPATAQPVTAQPVTAQPATAQPATALAAPAQMLSAATARTEFVRQSDATAADQPTQTVSFAGVSIEVPASWPVVDVDGTPGCVRYDGHAVYLGTPSQSTCPARLIGRTTTVQILRPVADQPADQVAPDTSPVAGASDASAQGPRVVRSDVAGNLLVADDSGTRAVITMSTDERSDALSIASTATVDGHDVMVDPLVTVAMTDGSGGAASEEATGDTGSGDTGSGGAAYRASAESRAVHPAAYSRDLPADGTDTTNGEGGTDTTDPTDSTDSTDPTDSTDSTDSTDTTDPTDSTDSTDSTGSTDSTDPAATGVASTTTTTSVMAAANTLTGVPYTTFKGMVMDACQAPSADVMEAWLDSSYRGIGVYIGGVARACSQPNLTKDWVTRVTHMGWKLVPIYVGLQAPKSQFKSQIDPAKAAQQGRQAASDAVAQMAALGLGPGNPIYLDMEAWNTTQPDVTAAVMKFMDAWTETLHEVNYLSGVYSSVASGINALVKQAQTQSSFHVPDAVWYARWYAQDYSSAEKRHASITEAHVKARTKFDTLGLVDDVIPANLWSTHQRGWQYLGGHTITHQGYAINLDSSLWDGPVAPAGADAIKIQQSSLPKIIYNQPYKTTLTSTGQNASYQYAATAGTLPPGLTLSPRGTLTGTVTKAGVWTVTVFVTDTSRPGAFGARTYQLVSGFPDVKQSSIFFGDITWLANSGITAGFTDGTFRPGSMITRGAMAAFLYRYTHPDNPVAPKCGTAGPNGLVKAPFTDVPTDGTFCGDIAWLAGTGITTGYTDGTFRPQSQIRRGEMAAFLYRLQNPGEEPTECADVPFPDVDAASVFCGAIAWFATSSITEGQADGRFHSADRVSRQSMAAFLHRMADRYGRSGVVSV